LPVNFGGVCLKELSGEMVRVIINNRNSPDAFSKEFVMKKWFLFCGILGLVVVGTFVSAQEKARPKPTIASELDNQLSMLESDFVSLAETMPEEKYSFTPSTGQFKGVRTFAQQVKHVGFANHLFFGAIIGEKAETGTGQTRVSL
jgi:hypothetical protein